MNSSLEKRMENRLWKATFGVSFFGAAVVTAAHFAKEYGLIDAHQEQYADFVGLLVCQGIAGITCAYAYHMAGEREHRAYRKN
ncbi:MAG: hypothetical protein AABW88_02790 [Nanoarchaeota archaeon]|mgnify:CR=1